MAARTSQEVPLPIRRQPARVVQEVPAAIPLSAGPLERASLMQAQALGEKPIAPLVAVDRAADRAVKATPGALTALGNVMRSAFPSIDAARTGIATDVVDATGKGQVGRAIGAGLRGVVTLPAAAATDLVARPALAARAAGDNAIYGIVNGALGTNLGGGSKASTTDAIPAAALPAAVAPKAAGPVASALAQGREAAVADPQAQLADAIATVLGRNPSISDLQAVGALIPTTTKMSQTAKDATFGSTAKLSGAIFQQQLADAAAAHGVGTPEYKEAFNKATAAYFQRDAGLVGFDPTKLATAQLLMPDEAQ